jgi:alkylation response protein AidB-like acyl-CoA dehydrogenase
VLSRIYDGVHETFRDSVRKFLLREVWPHVDEHASQKSLPRSLWLAAGAQGLLGLEVPERYEGSAAEDYRYNALLIEELAGVNLALASSLSVHFDVVAPYLVHVTTEEQRERWLPPIASGEVVTAIAMTEPSAGSDLAALRTSAEWKDGSWVLNGSKTFITNGYSADLVIVAARTIPGSGANGITLFAVEASMPGFTRGRKLDKAGQPEADTAELFFDDEHVPSRNVIGEAIAYAKQREAFGVPIGTLQHNKFLIADLVTRADVTQSYVDRCVLAHSRGDLSAVDAAKAKWWSAEAQNEIIDHCVQLHGGYGFMNDYRVTHAWRDARVTKIWAGSNEIMKEIIGRDLGL